MHPPIEHPDEPAGNDVREAVGRVEARSLRTFTPTQAVVAKSAGVFHWTPDGRRLYDFTSGVLVSNLGHNPAPWVGRFLRYSGLDHYCADVPQDYTFGLPLTAYNAITPVEAEATRRLVELLRYRPGGGRMEQVLWAASGSEAVHKALFACQARDRDRPVVLATRYGFHGKKGWANAVTGSEADPERDPRVQFITFPTAECRDVTLRDGPFDPAPYRDELADLLRRHGRRIGALVTEPYLGGGGSYHPPAAYLQLLQEFCRANDIVFVLDEVQSNFGRTGKLFAFETYGIEPDLVVLGKGLGNGVPVAAVVGRTDLFAALGYGEASDTWSANPLSSAAVLATLDEFAARDVLGAMAGPSADLEAGLVALKRFPFVAHVRGERGGMVWGVEFADHAGRPAADWANAFVLAAYRGDGPKGDGVHLLGPLAKKVVRVAPPLVITGDEVAEAVGLLYRVAVRLAEDPVAYLLPAT
ncbi:MAG: aminotransferase class III-fold pyridoxal phosphate-dependent enzyme [Gemmataceae bacterium]|nr:aminotransferase class III-fold pyridoxal phosphate-dependent enzyme [Gemmataceae bacterium]